MIYNTKVYLAPMAGVADEVFRKIVSSYGSAIPFTEMISAKAMHYDDKKTLAFSDNVQDAAHRAGFFNARTAGCRCNFRAASLYYTLFSEKIST